MKAFFIPVFAGLILLACSKTETNTYDSNSASLAGSWKEYEAYMDPGDGSGIFHKVDGILLTINPDSSYTCAPEHYVWGIGGKIALINDSTMRITKSQAAIGVPARFWKHDNILEFSYICLEGCGSRLKTVSK